MVRREITHTKKDKDGDILAICNPNFFLTWSPRKKADAINDIEKNIYEYFVAVTPPEVKVRVVNDPAGKYLRTTQDSKSKNNLDNLPDC